MVWVHSDEEFANSLNQCWSGVTEDIDNPNIPNSAIAYKLNEILDDPYLFESRGLIHQGL